jgi:hypothetical protein
MRARGGTSVAPGCAVAMGVARLGIVAAISATLIVAGCGSTAPVASAPSPVPAPASQTAPPPQTSLVGQWGGNVGIGLLYRNPDQRDSSHCDASASVSSHTARAMSASVGFSGSSMNSDKECGRGFSFSAEIGPDGTITSALIPSASFSSEECDATSDPAFGGGSVSSTGFTIVLTDSSMCRWPPLLDPRNPKVKPTERTFTVVIDRRRSS